MHKYNIVIIDRYILDQALYLISKYGMLGLRTLDSIQLSTCLTISNHVDGFYTADKFLQNLFEKEGLPLQIPS